MKKIRNIISTILIVGLGVMAVSLFILKASGKSLNSLPFQVSQIMTGSMEPTLHAPTENKKGKTISGDVVIIYKKNINKIKVGDIVAYLTDINNDGYLDTVVHRVTELDDTHIRIAGDASGSLDETFSISQFEDKYMGKIAFNNKAFLTTWLFRILTQAWGFICFIALPLTFIIVRSVLQLIKALNSDDIEEESTDEKITVEYGGHTFTEEEISKMILEREELKKNDEANHQN